MNKLDKMVKEGRVKHIGTAVFLCIFAVLFSFSSQAISIGLSPAKIDFDNVLKSGYAERLVVISTTSSDDLEIEYKVEGEISDWLRFEPNDKILVASQAEPYQLRIIVEPPEDAENRRHTGRITFITRNVKSPGGGVGASVKVSVIMDISVSITGEQIKSCSSSGVGFKDTEVGMPISYSFLVRNRGNVRVTPAIDISVMNQQLTELMFTKSYTMEEVLPTTERLFERKIADHGLQPGQYWIDVRVRECELKELLTFDVLEKGAVSDKGGIIKIENKPWIYTGETTPVKVYFSNDGIRDVLAVYKGEVLLDDIFVQPIETEQILVSPGETGVLTTYFTPKKTGQYHITGRVHYNQKISFEKGTIVNVNPGKSTIAYSKVWPLLIYLVIIITIIILVRMIIRERRRK